MYQNDCVDELNLNIPRGILRRIHAFYWLTSVETNEHIIFYAINA
jgi:hypothetical protein